MWAFKQDKLRPEISAVASEVFARSWHFIERDPVLAGHDRETLQAELARRIFEILNGGHHSERDLGDQQGSGGDAGAASNCHGHGVLASLVSVNLIVVARPARFALVTRKDLEARLRRYNC